MKWSTRKLVDLCSIRTGKLNSNQAVENGEYPFFTCAPETLRINKFSFDTEAVLLAGNNAAGVYPLKYYKGKFDAYQRTYLFETLDENILNVRYLYYALIPVLGYFQSVSIGASTQYLTKPVLDNFELPLPSIRVQQKITNILSAYDDQMENNLKRIALLEESARLLYLEWFVRLRFPGHEHTRIVDGVPEGWEMTTAYEVMEVLSGGTPKTSEPEYWDGEIPFYTPKDAMRCCYILETEKTLTEKGLYKCNSRLYPKNTIFITARGTVGNLNLAQRPMAMNQSCYALRGKGEIPTFYLFCALQAAVDQFKQRAVGAVFDAIIVDTFKLIPFVWPATKYISVFEEQVQPIFRQVENLLLQNQKLKQSRDLLLPRLMSGEIEV